MLVLDIDNEGTFVSRIFQLFPGKQFIYTRTEGATYSIVVYGARTLEEQLVLDAVAIDAMHK